ncbi:MAG: hypothetical protein K1Y36_13260 [Blastocatellia bacterium]|nr:hypothetical protein [Blastocatellia bacterium]
MPSIKSAAAWAVACALSLVVSGTWGRGQTQPKSYVQAPSANPAPQNLDFEDGEPGKQPPGWNGTTAVIGYPATISTEKPKTGKQCLVLVRKPDQSPEPNQFANVMQTVDATPYRGKRVRFRAAVRLKAQDFNSRAQLWLRADLPNQKAGFFDNMGDRPIITGTWQSFEIVGDIDPTAEKLNFGVISFGTVSTYLDEVSLEVLPTVPSPLEPARPLTAQGLANLTAFTRLMGYVRFFHPSDEAAAVDWDRFTVEGMRKVEAAKNSAELIARLHEQFGPIAPAVQVFATGKPPQLPAGLTPQAEAAQLNVIKWSHRGIGLKKSNQNVYASDRAKGAVVNGQMPEGFSNPAKPFEADLGGGVSCRVPLALWVDASGTLPHVEKKANPVATLSEPLMELYSANDRATRLADVALAWNIFQHFYPYFDVVAKDWSRQLPELLRAAATDKDEKAFYNTLRHLMVMLEDGHGGVSWRNLASGFTLPFLWDQLDGKLVLIHVATEGAAGLKPGDEILEINQKPAAEALKAAESLTSSATPQWRLFRALRMLRVGDKDTEVTLKVLPFGENLPKTITIKRTLPESQVTETRPEKTAELKPGVFYYDIGRASDADFAALLPKLEKAKGVIFDLRGYPVGSPVFLQHLADIPLQSARWNIPLVSTPDHVNMTAFETGGRWSLEPKKPKVGGKIVFLTDGRAVSYAESVMGIVEAYKLGEIIGSPTAGTNGNINPFTLPGGFTLYWTGMKVLKHDGSRHHGVGIAPTIPLQPTQQGVAAKRDELLEKALEIIH